MSLLGHSTSDHRSIPRFSQSTVGAHRNHCHIFDPMSIQRATATIGGAATAGDTVSITVTWIPGWIFGLPETVSLQSKTGDTLVHLHRVWLPFFYVPGFESLQRFQTTGFRRRRSSLVPTSWLQSLCAQYSIYREYCRRADGAKLRLRCKFKRQPQASYPLSGSGNRVGDAVTIDVDNASLANGFELVNYTVASGNTLTGCRDRESKMPSMAMRIRAKAVARSATSAASQ